MLSGIFNKIIGLDDRVKCFFCGNILGYWEKDDDFWKEYV